MYLHMHKERKFAKYDKWKIILTILQSYTVSSHSQDLKHKSVFYCTQSVAFQYFWLPIIIPVSTSAAECDFFHQQWNGKITFVNADMQTLKS